MGTSKSLQNNSVDLYQIGQSVWYDNIQRDLIENDTLEKYIKNGIIYGVTSNPTIFEKAIINSQCYQENLQTMAWAGLDEEAIYEALVLEDIQKVADLFKDVYNNSKGKDGHVSLEVSPLLAKDSEKSIEEAERLWHLVNRPNLMIKIPATMEGIPAIRECIKRGINVNVTLIFSVQRYALVIDAYLSGLEDRIRENKPIDTIASVASIFISRVDTKVDGLLQVLDSGENDRSIMNLQGKAAIANANLAYKFFQREFQSNRFLALKEKGAKYQRPLWASTSTKNPNYSDLMYVEELMGENTVNTITPETLQAFIDHGVVKNALADESVKSEEIIKELFKLGIDIEEVAAELEEDGVQKFSDSYHSLLHSIHEQVIKNKEQIIPYGDEIFKRIQQLDQNKFVQRMFAADPYLWTDNINQHQEIIQRLGWLNPVDKSKELLIEIEKLIKVVHDEGYTHALLIGMGGSSLAPEVMRNIIGFKAKGLDLAILDSTHPQQILSVFNRSPIEKTIFIVSSKSGTTSEVKALESYFWQEAKKIHPDLTGKQFIAITDPGSSLENLAREKEFRSLFIADPDVGGRYSALTAFGLVPAGLMGFDIGGVLDQVDQIIAQYQPHIDYSQNPGLVLGSILGELCLQGRNKLTIFADKKWQPFGSWLEQLVAESSGKNGRGIVPIDCEPLADIGLYKNDRLFVYFRNTGDYDEHIKKLGSNNQPVLVYGMNDENGLLKEFYRWEYAVAVACGILGVNAFDQPNVQESKDQTKKKIAEFKLNGKFHSLENIWEDDSTFIFTNIQKCKKGKWLNDFIIALTSLDNNNSYYAINAFVARNDINLSMLKSLREKILRKTGCATTLGFGPRFLHSTGQLHKGGPDQGIFLIITDESESNIEIPNESLEFRTMIQAQALGDIEALLAHNRKVLHLHFKDLSQINTIDI